VTEKQSSGWGKGCAIAAVVVGLVVAVCGGAVTLISWSIWQNPNVQRGVEIAGAAMDLTREAMTAPGTAELRRAGCAQAMVYSPELIERFIGVIRPDAGVRRGEVPDYPLVVCQVRGQSTLSCETVARTYAEAVTPAPTELGVTIQGQRGRNARCQGVYGPDGTFLRPPDDDQRRIGNMGQTGGP
jgi:hypothetical protein